MTEHPINLKAWEVRAIIDGRKTMTRRIIKPQPDVSKLSGPWRLERRGDRGWGFMQRIDFQEYQFFGGGFAVKWRPDDTLWVRETWAPFDGDGPRVVFRTDADDDGSVPYLISGVGGSGGGVGNYRPDKWRSSAVMPRWASRITLLVTDVRVERVQDISEADAMAEGMIWQEPTDEDRLWWADRCAEFGDDPDADPIQGVWLAPGTRRGFGLTKEDRNNPVWGPTAAFAFRQTWTHLHGPDAWDANPWVSVTKFERVP